MGHKKFFGVKVWDGKKKKGTGIVLRNILTLKTLLELPCWKYERSWNYKVKVTWVKRLETEEKRREGGETEGEKTEESKVAILE